MGFTGLGKQCRDSKAANDKNTKGIDYKFSTQAALYSK
jgi:hypothetical protein